MEKEFIEQAVLAAAQEVFSTMLGMEASLAPTNPSEEEATADTERVVALIGIAGSYVGTGMIGCSTKFACSISSVMMMGEYSAVDSDVLDAMGEMANMIFGSLKTCLEAKVGSLGLSIPTVVFGRNFGTRSLGGQSWVNVPILIGEEEVDIRFFIAPNKNASMVKHGFRREYSLSEA